MGRLILHMGAHKTGSSAIQLWLTQNEQALRQADIFFPSALLGARGNGSRLARAMVLSPTRRGEIDLEARGRFLSFCKDHAHGDVILSAERFESELLPQIDTPRDGTGQEAGAAPADYAKIVDNLDLIRSFAREAGFSGVTMVYLVRNLVDRTNSGFAQRVKAMARDTVEELTFDPVTAPYRDHAACNRLIEACGFKIAMDVTDPSEASVVEHVMRLVGLDARIRTVADMATPRANESIGQLGVLAGMHLARVIAHGPQDDLVRRRRLFSMALKTCCTDRPDTPFLGFLPEDAEFVTRKQAALNLFLTPWMSSERITMMAEPRRSGPRSPLSFDELDDAQTETVREILRGVAELICNARRPLSGYSRATIEGLGALQSTSDKRKKNNAKEEARAKRREKQLGKAGKTSRVGETDAMRTERKLARQAARATDGSSAEHSGKASAKLKRRAQRESARREINAHHATAVAISAGAVALNAVKEQHNG